MDCRNFIFGSCAVFDCKIKSVTFYSVGALAWVLGFPALDNSTGLNSFH